MKQKNKNVTIEVTPNQDTVDNQLELLKYVAQVQQPGIKKELTSDYILAKLPEKDKTATIELAADAYFALRIIQLLYTKSKGTPIYNHKTRTWTIPQLEKHKQTKILELANRIFESYTKPLDLTSNLNRNVEKNYILQLISNATNQPQEIIGETAEKPQKQNLLEKITQKLKKQKQPKEET